MPERPRFGKTMASSLTSVRTRLNYWLSLAAAPIFAMMALLTKIHGGSMPDMLCSAGQGGSPLTGMVPMYVLMSAFHLAPWLKLHRRRINHAPETRARHHEGSTICGGARSREARPNE